MLVLRCAFLVICMLVGALVLGCDRADRLVERSFLTMQVAAAVPLDADDPSESAPVDDDSDPNDDDDDDGTADEDCAPAPSPKPPAAWAVGLLVHGRDPSAVVLARGFARMNEPPPRA